MPFLFRYGLTKPISSWLKALLLFCLISCLYNDDSVTCFLKTNLTQSFDDYVIQIQTLAVVILLIGL